MNTLEDLLGYAKTLTGPDRDLDKALWYKLIFDPALAKEDESWVKLVGSGYPLVTSSLNHTMTLCDRVLPGWLKFVGDLDPTDMKATATVAEGLTGSRSAKGFAPQGQYALALVIAILEALISQRK